MTVEASDGGGASNQLGNFVIQVESGPLAGLFLRDASGSTGIQGSIGFAEEPGDALKWHLDGTKVSLVQSPAKQLQSYPLGETSPVGLLDAAGGVSSDMLPMQCTVGDAPGRKVICTEASSTLYNLFIACSFTNSVNVLLISKVGYIACEAAGGRGYLSLSLKAVPI